MKTLAAGNGILQASSSRWIGAITLLLGVLFAVAVGLGSPSEERTFVAVSEPAQLFMSVTVPFLGVLLVGGLRRPAPVESVVSTVAAAVGLAFLIAAYGVLVCAVVTAVVPSTASGGRWENAGVVVVGSLLMQGSAQLVGTGLGLLLRRPVIACLATIVLPLGLWGLFQTTDALREVGSWTTPYPSAQHLLSGEMSGTAWAQWLVVVAIWGVGLNSLGIAKASANATSPSSRRR